MDEQAIQMYVKSVLAEQYGRSNSSLHSLNTRSLDDERIVYKMYRVDAQGLPSWVMFAAHDALVEGRTFRWGTSVTPRVWLEQRAILLSALAEQRYPAPRVIPALSGSSVIRSGEWSILVTTFIEGQQSQFFPEPLSNTGAMLARLHTLPHDLMPSWPSWWNGAYSLPHGIKALESVTTAIPSSHRVFYRACRSNLHDMLHVLPSIPEVLIHGDCWMQNAVWTKQGMVLIDWESAGRGAALLDLSDFLLRSQCDVHGTPPHTLNEQHILVAVSGYALHRMPSGQELDLLALATRFSIVWRAAWMFTRVLSEGWTFRLGQGLTRVQATYDIAEPTASVARSAFREHGLFVS